MKNNKRIMIMCMLVTIALSFSGCKLAKEETKSNVLTDRMIGCYITTEWIGNEKIYAKLVDELEDGIESKNYYFENMEGMAFYSPTIYSEGKNDYINSRIDEKISGASSISKYSDDNTRINELSGTIYITKENHFHINPVYQDKSGKVYMVSADVASYVTTKGAYESFFEETKNVKVGNEIIGEKTKIDISFEYVPVPENISLIYMDSKHNVVEEKIYEPGNVPKTMTVPEDVEYILVEVTGFNQNEAKKVTHRELYNKNAEYAHVLSFVEDAICKQSTIMLSW